MRKDFLGMESWLNTSAHIMKKRNSNVNFVRTDFLEMETSINPYCVSPHCKCYTQCVAYNMWRHTVCGMQYTGERTNKCNFCHKRFCWMGNLIEHNCMHSEEKPFKCKLCDKRFSWNYEENKFKCKFGEKWFCRNGNFNEHECTHSKEKPF